MESSDDAERRSRRQVRGGDKTSDARRPKAEDPDDWLKKFIDGEISVEESATETRFSLPRLPLQGASYLAQPNPVRSRALWFGAGFAAAFSLAAVMALVLVNEAPDTSTETGKIKPLAETVPAVNDSTLPVVPAVIPDPSAKADLSLQVPPIDTISPTHDDALLAAPAVTPDPSLNANITPPAPPAGPPLPSDDNALLAPAAAQPDQPATVTITPPAPPAGMATPTDDNALLAPPTLPPDQMVTAQPIPPARPFVATPVESPLQSLDSTAPPITATPLPPLPLRPAPQTTTAAAPATVQDPSTPAVPAPPTLALAMTLPSKASVEAPPWPADTVLHIRILFDQDGLDAATANTLAYNVGKDLGGALPVEMIPRQSKTDEVRYFFPEDRIAATHVADNIGHLTGLQEPVILSRAVPPPAPGTVEINLPIRTERILKNEGL